MKDMNHRMVFVMRLLDIGREDINLFCNFISKGMNESTYNNIITHALQYKIYFWKPLQESYRKRKKFNKEHEKSILDLKVSAREKTWIQVAVWNCNAHILLFEQSHRVTIVIKKLLSCILEKHDKYSRRPRVVYKSQGKVYKKSEKWKSMRLQKCFQDQKKVWREIW